VGWPLFLVLAGGIAFAVSLLPGIGSPGAGLTSPLGRRDGGPEQPGPG
jgi:hypothetical protein